MSINVAQNDFTSKLIDFDTFTKILPKNVGDFGKIIVLQALNSCPKCNKSHNLVTLIPTACSSILFYPQVMAINLPINLHIK